MRELRLYWALYCFTCRKPIAVERATLPSLSNFTDFDPLLAEPSASLRFCSTPEELGLADVVDHAFDLAWGQSMR
jgi:hypothetical protein